MQQLEFFYGRPELLIESQLKVVRKIKDIPEDSMEKIIPMAIKIQNLVAFLERLPNAHLHLCNPTLCKEIVLKLPMSKRDQWIRHALNIKPYYTLIDFKNWITIEAQYLSLVIKPCDEVSDFRLLILRKKSRSRSKKKSKKTLKQKCYHCKHVDHTIINCAHFKKMSTSERWCSVKKLGACFTCLKKGHRTIDCKVKRICGVNNCKRHHHKLLHEGKPKTSVETRVNESSSIPQNDGEVLHKIAPVKFYGTQKPISTLTEPTKKDPLNQLEIDEELRVQAINSKIESSVCCSRHHRGNHTIKAHKRNDYKSNINIELCKPCDKYFKYSEVGRMLKFKSNFALRSKDPILFNHKIINIGMGFDRGKH